MMQHPRIAVLVNGSSSSIEAVRARGLTDRHPPDKLLLLYRETRRDVTAFRWAVQLEAFGPEVVYVINTAMPGALLACWWRLRRGVPFVLDTGDVIGTMARSAGTAPLWKRLCLRLGESLTERLAHAIVVRGTEHERYLVGRRREPVLVLRDGYCEATVTSAQVEALRRQLGLEHVFVVGVLGSLIHSPRLNICYGWDLIDALAKLRDLPIHGIIVGDGNGRRWLEARARQLGVAHRVTFCGRVPYQDVPLYVRLFDIALSTQTNNLAGRVRTTGKLPEYMAAERFILASKVGEAARLLPDSMLIEYRGEVDNEYPQKLATRIEAIWRNPTILELRHTLPSVAEQYCSYRVLSQHFDALMCERCGGGARSEDATEAAQNLSFN
jgi:glycosyltransferase involved in cell wall biosynthesis